MVPPRDAGTASVSGTESRAAHRGRVLVVDDEPVTARAFSRLLTAAGYDVATALSGLSAAAILQPDCFDVVVSDLAMPEMDGLELLQVLRERDLDVPMIFVTGSPHLDTAVRAVDGGAFRYLVKPVPPNVLEDTVERAVRLRAAARIRREALAHRQRIEASTGSRATLEARFAQALATMWIAQQPIVSWSQRRVFAHEALVRNDEPTLRSPLDLFDAAERLGRLHELGRSIRALIAGAMHKETPPGHLFVNLHPTDLEDAGLYQEAAPLWPFASQVVFEITERAALDTIPDLQARMARLRELGYRIALDDLGAGYAGLASFTQLEPDVVKVDMSLIRGIDDSPMKQKLVGSIMALCQELGITIIAEGIETAGERDMLVGLGGDLCQGYLFAKPGRGFPEPVY
jgi:EAL domain-containing protein (putative c-di-GMP-specific phosphodiesterase class I)